SGCELVDLLHMAFNRNLNFVEPQLSSTAFSKEQSQLTSLLNCRLNLHLRSIWGRRKRSAYRFPKHYSCGLTRSSTNCWGGKQKPRRSTRTGPRRLTSERSLRRHARPSHRLDPSLLRRRLSARAER